MAINLFRKLGAVLPGSKDQGPAEVEEDQGGFGPPGGVLWTTPVDVLSDRPKAAPLAQPSAARGDAALTPSSLPDVALDPRTGVTQH